MHQVASAEEARQLFQQVVGEVPGSPVFTMKLAPRARHLEVQLLWSLSPAAAGGACELEHLPQRLRCGATLHGERGEPVASVAAAARRRQRAGSGVEAAAA